MRRISLAVALTGALAAVGCGGNVSPDSGSGKGIEAGTFTVTIQNTAPLDIKGGNVVSTPAGINCGIGVSGIAACEASFPVGTAVTLTATPVGVDAGKAYLFGGWAGDCWGTGACKLLGNADRYVLAAFSTEALPHPAFGDPKIHDPAFAAFARGDTGAWACTDCHGATLQGSGMAVACTQCHAQDQADKFLAVLASPTKPVAGQESCNLCHAGAGPAHQAVYDSYADATKMTATIDTVVVTPNAAPDLGTFKTVVTFTLKNNGQPVTSVAALKQKRYAAQGYNATTKTFDTALNFGFSAAVATATPGTFTVTAAKAPYDITTSNAFLYFYFGDATVIPPEGHYTLMDNVVSVAKVYGTIGWTSTASVSGCQKCHGNPYQKHGYRQAVVPGLADFVACKACHTDQRGGVDFNLAMTAEDPLRLAELEAIGASCGGELCWSAEDEATYAYTATTMADTHIAHAKEFLYPQEMSNCATCHDGKLDRILTDANFTGNTCKSCHLYVAAAGEDPKRAPVLAPAYHEIDWVKGVLVETDNSTVPPTVTELQCNACHADNADVTAFGGTNTPNDGQGPMMFGNEVPLFSDLHVGKDNKIYDAAGTKFSSAITAQATSATFDGTSKKLTVGFSVSGAAADALIRPTLVVSLYGYDTKDFVISGHSSQFADKTPNLEWAEGAVIRGTTTPANTNRLTVSPATATAGKKTWTVTTDLTTWAAKLADGSVKRLEIAFLPVVGLNQAAAVNTDPAKGAINPAIAAGGVARTFDLVANALVADAASYGKAIVSVDKCNQCHDALGMSFHTPSYGSAGVVGCRLCHFVGTGGSHLEMQSRSIDSYVHSIHSFQAFDIQNYDFADELSAFQYEHHTSATYPYFTTFACESCHNAGTYGVADVKKSLPGIHSASSAIKGKIRSISGVPIAVTGPSARACGGCHRAEMVKADDAAKLQWFDAHTGGWGYRSTAASSTAAANIWGLKIDELFP
jgi:hypothetical protein